MLAAGALACAAGPARAQDDAAAPPAEPEPAAIPVDAPPEEPLPATSATLLDDVVVTARRRKEKLADVPASLLVLDGRALADAGLTLATDLQERVAGLIVSVPNARLTSYTIRGLGSSSANDGIESSVGLFLDGIYLGRQGISIFDLVDLERVEVLRGPQGTLSGKNTTAGAINIVTRAPEGVDTSNLELTAGGLGARLLRGSIDDGTLGGEYAGRVTGYMTARDGTLDNVYNGALLNDRDKHGARAQGVWRWSETGSGRFIAEYGGFHESCCAFPLTAPVRQIVQERDAFMEYQRIGTDFRERRTDSDAPTTSDMRQQALSGELSWDLGGDHVLTAIGGWRDWFFVPLNDDATSLHLASTSTRNRHQQLSEEVRLASDFGFADSVVGLYFIHQQLRGLERVILGDDIIGWVFGGAIRDQSDPNATETTHGPALYAAIPPESVDGMVVDTNYFQRSDGVAAFGSMDWHLTDALDLTTGARYTYEWKEAGVDRHRYGGNPEASPLAQGDDAGPALDAAFPGLFGQDAENVTWKGIIDDVAGGEYARGNHMREGNWSAQLALSWAFHAADRVYASLARGYKGGGINLGFTGETIGPVFRPEEATSLEVGSKLRLLDRIFVSLAAYHTDVKDYQALTFDNEETLLRNPRQINLLNIGRVQLRGVELESYGYVLPGLTARVGMAWSDTLMKSFPNAPNEVEGTNSRDLSGQRLYNAPEWSGNAGAEYEYVVGGAHTAYAALDWSFKSDYWGTVEHGTSSYIEGSELWNARAGLRAIDRGWDVTAWSRNLLDDTYVATVYPLYGVGDYGAIPGDARTFGLTARLEFQ
jgi:iron complex outermembrane receptor protein